MRDKNGCVILDEYQELPDAYKIGRKEKVWLIKDNNKVLFKYGSSNYEIWAELIAEQLGIQCGIDMAEYDLATYNGKKGILSKDFRENGKYAITFEKFVEQIQHVLVANDIAKDIRNNSVQNIISAIFFDDIDDLTEDIINELICRWAFYGLIMESDKNATNLSLIKDSKTIKLSKDYDNSTMCRMNENINEFIKCIRTNEDVYKLTDNIQQSLTLENDDSPIFLHNFEKLCKKYPKYSDLVMQRFQNIDVSLAIDSIENKINDGNLQERIEVPWKVKFWLNKAIGLRYKDMCSIYSNSVKMRNELITTEELEIWEEHQIKGNL